MTLRAIIVADPLRTTREVAKELNINHSTVIWCLMRTGKVNKLNKRCLMRGPKMKKYYHFELLSSLILYSNNGPFLDWIVIGNEKWIVYNKQ